MNSPKTLWIGCLICLLFLAIAGHAYVVQTVHVYSGSCEKLHGMPGVLQRAGFVPSGNCKMNRDHNCMSTACEVNGKLGHCTTQPVNRYSFICVCVPDKPSR